MHRINNMNGPGLYLSEVNYRFTSTCMYAFLAVIKHVFKVPLPTLIRSGSRPVSLSSPYLV
jgi:hypothetical protein